MMQEIAKARCALIFGRETEPAVKLPAREQNIPSRALERGCQRLVISVRVDQECRAIGRLDPPAVPSWDADSRCFYSRNRCKVRSFATSVDGRLLVDVRAHILIRLAGQVSICPYR